MWNGKHGLFQSYVSLRVYGKGLIPEQLTERLKMEPSLASAHREVGSWVYCTKGVVDTLCPLEVHIRFIIHQVRRRRKIFASIQRKYRTDLLCYFASESDIGG